MTNGFMPRKQVLLGIILEREGYLSREQVAKIIAEQDRLREKGQYAAFGQIALALKYLSPLRLQRALQLQAKLAVPPGERKRLGFYLMEAGLITPTQLQQALEEQASTGGKLGDILIRKGLLDKEMLGMVLKLQAGERDTKAPGLG